ncbi:MAG: hypothetical protein Q9213_002630 [Squamulea squamosa]
MRCSATAVVSLLLLFLLSPIDAIYADEAYQVDFHHVLLGTPRAKTTFLDRPSPASKASLLYTLSERSVLGAINPKDGSVIWRQQLGNASGLLKAPCGGNTLISAVNGTVQAWDAAEGRLVWDWTGSEHIKALEVVRSGDAGQGVYIVTQTSGNKANIRKLSEQSGTLLWEHEDGSGDTPYELFISTEGVHYVSLHSALLQGLKIRVTTLQPSSGVTSSSITLHADKDVSELHSIIPIGSRGTFQLLVWSDRSLRHLRINILGSNHIVNAKLIGENGKDIDKIRIHAASKAEGMVDVLVHCQSGTSHWAEVYQLHLNSQALKDVYQLPSLDGSTAFSATVHGDTTYFVRTTQRDVTLFSSVSDQSLGQWLLQPKPHDHMIKSPGITHAVSEVVSRGTSKYAVRSAVLLSSGDWKLVYNGEELWFRPESLAGVVAAAWADTDGYEELADELAMESHSNVVAAYLHRLKRHAKDAKKFPGWVRGLPDRIIDSLLGREPRSHGAPRDGFGFHKVVIAATDSGRLFALEAGEKGKIIWSVQASEVEPGQHWAIDSIEVDHDNALVRIVGGDSLRVNLKQGIMFDNQFGSSARPLKSSIVLPDTFGTAISVQVSLDGSLGLPKPSHLDPNMVVVTQDEKKVIRGWTLKNAKTQLAWKFVPRPNEKIVTLATRPLNDPVASIGKALGDRNVLYKFLSPNLLVIGTVTMDTSLASFYVLDSISGSIIHSQTHPNVDVNQPIVSVLSENWFAYSIFSAFPDNAADTGAESHGFAQGHQLVVSELFESSLPNDRGALGSASNSSSLHPFAVDGDGPTNSPYVVTQTYLIPAAISYMTVSSTLQGITPRSLLCVVPSLNSLIAIPRAFIDPRRPVGRDATAAEMEEGLFRHNAVLDFDPKWALNHQREVLGVNKVITTPSLLESTSLVFAFGSLDMFGTRIAPIGGFDMLGKGFNKIQLIGTVAALAVGTGLLAPMARKKQTDTRWKVVPPKNIKRSHSTMSNSTKYTSKLLGARVLIIGGTSGIGFAVAEASLEHGAHVIISSSQDSRVKASIERLLSAYPSAKDRLSGYACDLSSPTMEENIVSLFSKTGQLDHIVVTAGDKVAMMPIHEITLENIQQAGMVRFFALLLVAKHGFKILSPGPASSITLTTGAVSERPIAGWSIVASYAAGLHGMIRNLALDLAPVRVNLVSPGPLETEMWNILTPDQMQQYKQSVEREKSTTKKIGQPGDVAEAYLYLMKDRNCTGAVIDTNGGSLLV